MIVIHRDGVLGDETAVGIAAPLRVEPAGRIERCGPGRHRLDRDDPRGADADADRPVLLESPVDEIVVIARRQDHPQDEVALRPALDDAGRVVEMTPGDFAGRTLEEARGAGAGPRQAAIGDRVGVEEHGVLRAVEPRLE